MNVTELEETLAHRHGGDVLGFAREHRCQVEAVLDMSANTWPFPMPEALTKLLTSELSNIHAYPDIRMEEFQSSVSEFHNLDTACVIPGNGSIQLIYAICADPRYRSVLTIEPCFNEYRRAAASHNKHVHLHHCMDFDLLQIDLHPLDGAFCGEQIVFLCNPNNPLGVFHSPETIRGVLDVVRASNGLLVVDEAFIDFSPKRSVAQWVCTEKNLVVLRSLTKSYGLAGLRAGYALAHPDRARDIKRLVPPWSMNALAQRAGAWVLQNQSEFQRFWSAWLLEARKLENALRRLPHVEVGNSATSYLLFRLRGLSPERFESWLGEIQIMIRSCSDFAGLDRSYYRVGARTVPENRRFLSAVGQYLQMQHV